MSYEFYQVLHIFSIILLFVSISIAFIYSKLNLEKPKIKKLYSIIHGITITTILIAGFGMLAKMGMTSSWPSYIWFKICIWFLLGVIPFLFKKVSQYATTWFVTALLLVLTAIITVIYKPVLF